MSWFDRKDKLPKGIHDSLMPDRQFADKAKQQFLASFDFKQSSRPAGAVFLSDSGPSKMTLVWRTGGVALAAVGLIAATSAFADVQNVSPTNPLYPFKRLAESTELAFASDSAKPALELTFAARRAQEIQGLSAGDDVTSTVAIPLVQHLAGDFETDASNSLSATTDEKPSSTSTRAVPLASFCTAAGAIKLDFAKLFHPDFAARVMAACGFSTSTTAPAATSPTGTGYGSGSGSHSPSVPEGNNVVTTTTIIIPSVNVTVPAVSSLSAPVTGSASVGTGVSVSTSVSTPPVSVSAPGVSVTVPSLSL